MPQVGPLEILVIFVVALLVFGPSKLPGLARQVGQGIRELRRLQDNLRRDLDDVLADDESDAVSPPPMLPPKPARPATDSADDAPAPTEDHTPPTERPS
jgi:sec-independent protein translocase protein TatA